MKREELARLALSSPRIDHVLAAVRDRLSGQTGMERPTRK